MHLEIVTPDSKVFDGEIRLIQLPGSQGSFEILKNHAALISTLDEGKIKVIQNNGEQNFFDVAGGVVECSHNKIIVLVETV